MPAKISVEGHPASARKSPRNRSCRSLVREHVGTDGKRRPDSSSPSRETPDMFTGRRRGFLQHTLEKIDDALAHY
jgi:hypothetical protein